MRLLLPLLLLLATLAPVPTVVAHQCASASSSGDCVCPAPNDGQAHQHSNSAGSCQRFANMEQNAGRDGASQTPGFGAVLGLVGIALAVLVWRRG